MEVWRTVKRKLAQLKEEQILMRPHYDINYTKVSRNPLHKLYCIMETDQSYETVITYLQVIDSIRVIFPVFSPHKRVMTVIFFSSDDKETTSLLQILKFHGSKDTWFSCIKKYMQSGILVYSKQSIINIANQ